MVKIIFRILQLSLIAIIALAIDFILYSFTKTCAACMHFNEFLASNHSLFTPTWASLVILLKELKILK